MKSKQSIPQRTFWQQVQYGNEYSCSKTSLRKMNKSNGSRAHLVSSLCEDGLHMPAIDVDFQIEYFEKRTLVFHKEISKDAFLTLLQTLALCGIISEDYFHRRAEVSKNMLLVNKFIKFTVYEILCPVRLEESATEGHFHLFIDKPMEWELYKRLLHSLRGANIIDSKFLNLSLEHKQSFLFLPGQKEKIRWIYVEP